MTRGCLASQNYLQYISEVSFPCGGCILRRLHFHMHMDTPPAATASTPSAWPPEAWSHTSGFCWSKPKFLLCTVSFCSLLSLCSPVLLRDPIPGLHSRGGTNPKPVKPSWLATTLCSELPCGFMKQWNGSIFVGTSLYHLQCCGLCVFRFSTWCNTKAAIKLP